jgi:hypothetical protein
MKLREILDLAVTAVAAPSASQAKIVGLLKTLRDHFSNRIRPVLSLNRAMSST